MRYLCATMLIVFCTNYGWTGLGILFVGLYAVTH